MHYSNNYSVLTAQHYSRLGERHTDGETEKIEPKTLKNSPLRREIP